MDSSEYEGKFLNLEDVLNIHSKVIASSEVKDDDGFIDQSGSLFEGAVSSIFAGFGGIEMYPSVIEKAVRLCYNLIKDHCFLNANKRTGLMSMLSTLEMNGIEIEYNEDVMFTMISNIGSGTVSYEQFLEYITTCVITKVPLDLDKEKVAP